LKAYQADIAKFEEADTQIFGVSMDSVPANREFAKQLGVTFPLLSDWDRIAVKDYGIFTGKDKYLSRATFVIDKEGIIRHIEEGNTAIDPTGAFQACSILKKK
jgi:peroxiredoxin